MKPRLSTYEPLQKFDVEARNEVRREDLKACLFAHVVELELFRSLTSPRSHLST